jgi:hypothetical protein
MAGVDLSARPALVAINGPMCDDYRGKVVYRVLARLGQAPGELQRQFRSIVRGVSINGFRDPNDAPPALLQKHAKKIMLRSDEFVGIVLRIWVDSHAELKEVVVGHLAGRNMPTDGLDLSENRFAGSWNSESWVRERKKLVAAHSQFCEDDVALMLCCVTGRMPLPSGDDIHADEPANEMQEAFFSQWIDHLKALPAAAPQWEQAPDFIASITEILKEKEDERNRAEALNTAFAQIREEFADELAFFQWDLSSWSAAHLRPQRQAGQAAATDSEITELLRLTEGLQSLLTDYRAVHQIAPVVSEELVVGPKRSELQQRILEALNHIDQLLGETPAFEEELPPSSEGRASRISAHECATPEQRSAEEQLISARQDAPLPLADTQFGQPEMTGGPADDSASLAEFTDEHDEATDAQQSTAKQRPEDDGEPATDGGLSSSDGDYSSLKSENQNLRQEIRSLGSELRTNQKIINTWRVAYEKVCKELAHPNQDEFLPIEDVSTAVAVAKEKFADELLFQPNSKSDIEANPFAKPKTVWTALEWLATIYYRSRMGEFRVSDFNLSILKVCGWRYKGNQSNLTMRRYKPWYTTSLNGKTFWLKRHIGTGSGKDARHTIRIAFDWDKDRKIVVVGYIGQHQQTNAT